MTKVALITDMHFGARNDSVLFLDFYEKFYKNVFFPILKDRGISEIIILGDTFDRRKYVNFYTLKYAKEMFFDKLAELVDSGIGVTILVGNHDGYYKNTNNINSVEHLLAEYEFDILSKPTTLAYNTPGGTDICLIPWICDENYEASMEELRNTKATICMGHFEIEGFSMYKGDPKQAGISRDTFKKFDMTFSGHYHHKQEESGIYYLGNPYQLTWSDYGDTRGFHILDLDTRELEFIPNPYEMFYKLVYDDKDNDINVGVIPSIYENKYVKVIVANKTNPYLFDLYMNKLYEANPADVTIVEDFTNATEGLTEEMVDQAESTLDVINKVIDNDEIELDKTKLKNIMKELYVEALQMETA